MRAETSIDSQNTGRKGTGRDPRTARGNGHAVIHSAVHALAPAIERGRSDCEGDERAPVLGLNAAKRRGFEVSEHARVAPQPSHWADGP